MTKKKAEPKKAPKKPPPKAAEGNAMAASFDDAMTRIAKAPWPPKK